MNKERPNHAGANFEKLGDAMNNLSHTLRDKLEPSVKFATKKIRDFNYAISHAWNESRISTWYYNLKYGLINLWRWRRTIWRDRDWDHIYLLDIMKKKIEQMEMCERRWSLHISALRHAKQLMVCRLLIERIKNDDYFSWLERIKPGYNDKPTPFYMTLYRGARKSIKEALDVDGFMMHYPLLNPAESFEHENYMKQQDYDLLFKIMAKHIQEWWN